MCENNSLKRQLRRFVVRLWLKNTASSCLLVRMQHWHSRGAAVMVLWLHIILCKELYCHFTLWSHISYYLTVFSYYHKYFQNSLLAVKLGCIHLNVEQLHLIFGQYISVFPLFTA